MGYSPVYREIQAGVEDPFKVKAPWERDAGWQLREHEHAQLGQFHRWQQDLRKGKVGVVDAYVVPLKLNARVDAALREVGTPVGLAALYNQDGGIAVGVVPHGKDVPAQGEFIRVESASQRVYLPVKGSTLGDYYVVVEAWTPREPLAVYQDVEVQPAEISTLVTEAFGCDDLTGLVHALPLLSSPPRNQETGGVTVAVDTFGLSVHQVEEFQRDHRSLTPPEMRPWPHGQASRGHWSDLRTGVRMQFAQRPPQTRHSLTHFVASDPRTFLANAAADRGGLEESRHTSLKLASGSTRSKALATILGHATSHAALPVELDDAIDVRAVHRTVHRYADSRLWGAVAKAHLHPVPRIDGKAVAAYVDGVLQRIDGELESFTRRAADRRALLTLLAPRLAGTFVHVGSAIARADGSKGVDVAEAKQAHDLRLELFQRFVEKNRPVLTDLGNHVSGVKDPRYRAVQMAILAEPGITHEALWQQVGSQAAFDGDRPAFESTLRFMLDKFHAHEDARTRLTWLGGLQ